MFVVRCLGFYWFDCFILSCRRTWNIVLLVYQSFKKHLYTLIIACLSCCWDAITWCLRVGDWGKVFPFSTQISSDSAGFFPSQGKSHPREKIYTSTACSYFAMMKQKKFPIKINHMSDFSSDSASSQLRKYALAVDHGVHSYLLCSKWPIEKQTEIWASTDYEKKWKNHLILLLVYPWKGKMYTSLCLRQCLITFYKNKLCNSRPNIHSESLGYSVLLAIKPTKNWSLP